MSPPRRTPGGRISWAKIGDLDPMKGVETHFVALDSKGKDIGQRSGQRLDVVHDPRPPRQARSLTDPA